jgi:hypothetical protein
VEPLAVVRPEQWQRDQQGEQATDDGNERYQHEDAPATNGAPPSRPTQIAPGADCDPYEELAQRLAPQGDRGTW